MSESEEGKEAGGHGTDGNAALSEAPQVEADMRTEQPVQPPIEATGGADIVTKLQGEVKELQDRYLRVLADFENYKKRTLKERSELQRYQGEQIILDLLEVLDNLELALGYSEADHEKLKSGLQMIHKLFVERLGKWDVRGSSAVGQEFDPNKYSAISRVESEGNKPGTIVGELKKSYYYRDKLIRPGEVVVAA